MYQNPIFTSSLCLALAVGSMFSLEAGCCGCTTKTQKRVATVSQNSSDLVLYVNPKCPYCRKVTDYLQETGRNLPTKNTKDPTTREELIRLGGKSQVPCLVINGRALYESDDIIAWLKQHP